MTNGWNMLKSLQKCPWEDKWIFSRIINLINKFACIFIKALKSLRRPPDEHGCNNDLIYISPLTLPFTGNEKTKKDIGRELLATWLLIPPYTKRPTSFPFILMWKLLQLVRPRAVFRWIRWALAPPNPLDSPLSWQCQHSHRGMNVGRGCCIERISGTNTDSHGAAA